MKFSVRRDKELPAQQLFTAISDFARIERMLARRGVEVRRTTPDPIARAGSAWELGFDLRGKRRDVQLEVAELDAPENMILTGGGESLSVELTMTVIPLAASRSRIIFEAEVKPRSMRARLVLQTAKLGKAQLDRKFAERFTAFLNELA